MILEELAADFLQNLGNYEVCKINLSEHINWSVLKIPLDPYTTNFATLYSSDGLINFAITQGFSTSG